MRSESDFSASESQGVSSRAWLYLGALAVGFSLAAMADFDTIESESDLPSSPRSPISASEDIDLSSGTRSASAGTDRGVPRAISTVTTVTLDATPRVSARAP